MFTGIVQGIGQVISIKERVDEHHQLFRTHVIQIPDDLVADAKIGASIANNGCCLTITHINGTQFSFDLIEETLKLTNLGQLNIGDYVNLERAAKIGDEIGGHSMSGHITCTGKILDIIRTDINCQINIGFPHNIKPYILYKGFIGIDGISLTVGKVNDDYFALHLIPETLNKTTLGRKKVGDFVNIEIDPQTQAIIDTVERVLAEKR